MNETFGEPPKDLSVEKWEKKSELSLLNGDFGEAIKYAHYANCAEKQGEKEE